VYADARAAARAADVVTAVSVLAIPSLMQPFAVVHHSSASGGYARPSKTTSRADWADGRGRGTAVDPELGTCGDDAGDAGGVTAQSARERAARKAGGNGERPHAATMRWPVIVSSAELLRDWD
jgi:hypothetical protein